MTPAENCVQQLVKKKLRLVLVESCTCGLVASRLGELPGVSGVFCGSAVTYRDATKSQWVGVPRSVIAEVTSVSPEVAEAMARGALTRTAEADVAAAVTGYLGPESPPDLDGVVYFGLAARGDEGKNAPSAGAECTMWSEVRKYQTNAGERNARRTEVADELLRSITAFCRDWDR